MKERKQLKTVEIGHFCKISGTVVFSHVKEPYSGEELAKEITRQKKFIDSPVTVDHSRITLRDIRFDQKSDDDLSIYISDRLYDTDTNKNCYDVIAKSKYAIPIFHKKEKIDLEHELAKGSNVSVILETYSTNRNQNPVGLRVIGINIDDETITYFIPNGNNENLKKWGFI